MSNRERYIQIGESLTDGQLAYMLEIIEQAKAALDELEDDLYCENLLKMSEERDSDTISFEKAVKQSGIDMSSLKE